MLCHSSSQELLGGLRNSKTYDEAEVALPATEMAIRGTAVTLSREEVLAAAKAKKTMFAAEGVEWPSERMRRVLSSFGDKLIVTALPQAGLARSEDVAGIASTVPIAQAVAIGPASPDMGSRRHLHHVPMTGEDGMNGPRPEQAVVVEVDVDQEAPPNRAHLHAFVHVYRKKLRMALTIVLLFVAYDMVNLTMFIPERGIKWFDWVGFAITGFFVAHACRMYMLLKRAQRLLSDRGAQHISLQPVEPVVLGGPNPDVIR